MLNTALADADRAMVLVIDVQSKLLPFIEDNDEVLAGVEFLLRGAAIFDLPVLATEQYPKGIGPTVPSVADLLRERDVAVLVKSTFSACGDEPVRQALRDIDRPQTIVCGIEAHVCVQQTVLDLLSLGHQVFVCADAVGSRRGLDLDLALSRMQREGAVLTTAEALLFELCVDCTSSRFKQLLELVKSVGP